MIQESCGSEEVATILRSLEEARTERARLGSLGRWSEADEVALVILRKVLAGASPEITGLDLGGLVYVAGSPRPGRRRAGGKHGPVPAERLSAACAMLLVNRARNPQAAVELVHSALKSYSGRDLGTFWYSVLALAYAGERDLARHYLDRATACAGWAASLPHRSALTVLRARVAGLSGEPMVAWQLLAPALKDGVFDQFAEVAVAWAISALVDLGEPERAEDLLLAHGFAHSLEGVVDRAEVFAARGALREATGRAQLAYEDFAACGRELRNSGVENPAVIAWRSQAAACAAATGRRALALSLADEELLQARQWKSAKAVGTALRAVALVAEDGQDIKLLRDAVDLLSRGNARSTLMRAHYELGVKLCLRGDHEEGRAALQSSRRTAVSIGSRSWAGRADQALQRWVVPNTAGRLTSQELKVLNLARAGFGNKEIASRLQLGGSTVEFHLSKGYRKLRISGRRELQSAMVPLL